MRSSTDVFVQVHQDGLIAWVSRAVEDILGRSRGQVVGARWAELVHPDDASYVRASVTSGEGRFRARMPSVAGQWTCLEWSVNLGDDGMLYATGRVTEDVEVREQLRELQRVLKLSEELAHLGHWSLSLGAAGPVWSPEVFRIHGREPVLGPPPLEKAIDAYHPEDRAFVAAGVNRALETGETFSFERRIIRELDGSTRWVRAVGLPQRDADGAVTGIFGVFQDITEARERDRAMRELEERHALAFQTTLAAHWDWDLTTDLVAWSPRWFEMIGVTPDSTVGPASWFFERLHPEDAPRVQAAVERHFETGARYDLEFRMRVDDGRHEWVWIHATGQAVFDADGTPVRMFGAMLDTTVTHRALSALEDEVRRAQAANRAKTEFMANVSHEIRTPMNAILGLAELLGLTALSPDQRSALDDMASASQTLLRLIDDLLDLAKAEAGRLDLAIAPFDARKLLDDVIGLHRGRASERGLALQLQTEIVPGTILLGDAERIKQVIGNLLGNALKFTTEGHVRLSAEAWPDGRLELVVEDTGPGIPPERLESLFLPFEQLDASTTRRHGGVGLGLAICRELIVRMGGQLTASSELAQGSRFSVRVPLRPGVLPQRVAEAPHTPLPPGLQVLLAEDNAVNQRVARLMLERLGCEVTIAANGREAVATAIATPFDIVFMDVQMPELDGLAATRALRAAGFGASIVGLTAHAQPQDRARCLDAGMNAHVTKPVSIRALADALRTFAMRAQSAA